jgi:four helix bundle protein
MAGVRTHTELLAWQLCEELADLIIAITRSGPVNRDLYLCNQIRESSGATGPQIAEGFGRKTPREFAHYLRMAIGSLRETDTWLSRGRRNGYWSEATFRRAKTLCDRALDTTCKLLASKERQIARQDHPRRNRRSLSVETTEPTKDPRDQG